MMMFWYGGHLVFWQVALMWVGMIAFWGLLIWAVYALIAAISRRPDGDYPPRGESARRILDERLARGEINSEEYHRLVDALDHDRGRTLTGTGATQ